MSDDNDGWTWPELVAAEMRDEAPRERADDLRALRDRGFVDGHKIRGVVYEFPHVCPGLGCAIGEWLRRKAERVEYENLNG